jgi:hypothetical protein
MSHSSTINTIVSPVAFERCASYRHVDNVHTVLAGAGSDLHGNLFANEHFTQMQSLLLLQCLFNAVVAWLCVAQFSGRDDVWRRRDLVAHAGIGFTYVTGMLLSNTAHRCISNITSRCWSSRPSRFLSCSSLVIVGFRRFPVWKYVLGCQHHISVAFLFMIDSSAAGNAAVADTAQRRRRRISCGAACSCLSHSCSTASLLFSRTRSRRMATTTCLTRDRPTAFHLMLYVNIWASVVPDHFLARHWRAAGLCIRLARRERRAPSLRQSVRHLPRASASCSSSRRFATTALSLCSMITTTRKFSTVLLSVVLFGHPITAVQVVGVCLLFGALFVRHLSSTLRSPPSPSPSIAKKTFGRH